MINKFVQQGCPLSPILFAIITDILLRKLKNTYVTATTKAFADDTVMVIDNIDDLPEI